MEVMNIMHTFALLNGGLNLVIVHISGSGFHQSEQALFNCGVRSTDDDNCENEGDKGVSYLSFGPKPDDRCSNNYPN